MKVEMRIQSLGPDWNRLSIGCPHMGHIAKGVRSLISEPQYGHVILASSPNSNKRPVIERNIDLHELNKLIQSESKD